MPQPIYMSNDGKRVGTIAAMRAYEAEVGAPLDPGVEHGVLLAVHSGEKEFELRTKCADCGQLIPVGGEMRHDDIAPLCSRCWSAHEKARAALAAKGRCPDCAENRPLIEAVQNAVSYVSRNQPGPKGIALAWSAVDREFRRIYGDPE